jgi:dihydrofolate reductase
MRKVISLMHISLDGFAADAGGGFDWIVYDESIAKDVQDEILATVDTAIYGRATYLGMYNYWPTVPGNPESSEGEIRHANWVQNVQKLVFSTTLDKAEWNNTRLIKKNVAEEMTKLKEQPGKNMMIFGSPRLVHTFAELGLINEYRLTISPVALGSGVPLFNGGAGNVNLKLLHSKSYDVGVIGARYEVVR